MSESDPSMFDRLLERHFDGGNSAAEAQDLARLIRKDPGRARAFARASALHLQIRSVLQLGRQEGFAEPPVRRPARHLRLVGAAALVAVVASLGLMMKTGRLSSWQLKPGNAMTSAVPSAVPAAVLTATSGATWADADEELVLRRGDLPAGRLVLVSGLAEFTTADGAVCLVQGPATFEFNASDRLRIDRGKVVCRCPTEASRITVVTPQSQVTDLGTEFGVSVSDDSDTEVAVLQGQVRLQAGERSQILGVGQALSVHGTDELKPSPKLVNQFSHLTSLIPADPPPSAQQRNLLKAADFATAPRSAADGATAAAPWTAVTPNAVLAARAGRAGGPAVRIRAAGSRYWPWVSQDVRTGDVAGRQVLASVWAASAADDPLQGGQRAIVKVIFLDADGREFADAQRHFLGNQSAPGAYVQGVVAAVAPRGTVGVRFQVLLNAKGRSSGSVLFDDARLIVLPDPSKD